MEAGISYNTILLLVAFGLILAVARLLGELARAFRQPAIVGELAGGILLGPTILGMLAPATHALLFPSEQEHMVVINGISSIAVTLFLFIAGIEINFSGMRAHSRMVSLISGLGILFPFLIGLSVAWSYPAFLGYTANVHLFIFALFFASALSISSLPVITKTLLDTSLLQTSLGKIVIMSAIIDDIIAWVIFSIIIGVFQTQTVNVWLLIQNVSILVVYTVATLTLGSIAIDKLFSRLQRYKNEQSAILGLMFALALLNGALTERLGVHSLFGALLTGVVVGRSRFVTAESRHIARESVMLILAPIFFGGIGLKVNFVSNFDIWVVLVVIGIACIGKIIGCTLGARLSKLPSSAAWVIGLCMNIRGSMEIVLALIALEAGLIDERLFVALVMMAIVTSIMAGPMIRYISRREESPALIEGAMQRPL